MAGDKVANRKPTFVLVGDSLTQCGSEVDTDGWVALMQHELLRSVDILNRGLGGYTTQWIKKYAIADIVADIQFFQPVLVTLWLGTNDSVTPDSPRHVPLDEYSALMVEFVEQFKQAAPNAQILLVTPPPCAEADDHKNVDISAYAAAGVAIADKMDGVHVLDLNTFFVETYPDVEDRLDKFFRDGIHFKTAGNHVVYEQLDAKIKAILPADVLERLQSPDYLDLMNREFGTD